MKHCLRAVFEKNQQVFSQDQLRLKNIRISSILSQNGHPNHLRMRMNENKLLPQHRLEPILQNFQHWNLDKQKGFYCINLEPQKHIGFQNTSFIQRIHPMNPLFTWDMEAIQKTITSGTSGCTPTQTQTPSNPETLDISSPSQWRF